MTSRERVLLAAKGQKTDKIPCNFRAEVPTLQRLYEHIGHSDYDRLLEELKVDIRFIDCVPPKEKNYGSYFQNHWGERYEYRDSPWGVRVEHLAGALSDAKTLKEFLDFPWPTADMNDYSALKSLCEKYDEYGLIYGFADIFLSVRLPFSYCGW